MHQKVSIAKEVNREAKEIIHSQRLEQTRRGMEKMKKQMGMLEEEIDSLRMPIVDEFKVILLKQRANAYRRTVQGQIDREVNTDLMLPKISKQIERERRARGALSMLRSEPSKFEYNKKYGEVVEGNTKGGAEGSSAGKEVTFQSLSKSVMQSKYPSNMKRSPQRK